MDLRQIHIQDQAEARSEQAFEMLRTSLDEADRVHRAHMQMIDRETRRMIRLIGWSCAGTILFIGLAIAIKILKS